MYLEGNYSTENLNSETSQMSDELSLNNQNSFHANDNSPLTNLINFGSYGDRISNEYNNQGLSNQFDVFGNNIYSLEEDVGFRQETIHMIGNFDNDMHSDSFEYDRNLDELEKENIPPVNFTNDASGLTDGQEYQNYLIRKVQSVDRSVLTDITCSIRDSEQQNVFSNNYETRANFTDSNFGFQIGPKVDGFNNKINKAVKKTKNRNSIML